jgi:hypothetical protein
MLWVNMLLEDSTGRCQGGRALVAVSKQVRAVLLPHLREGLLGERHGGHVNDEQRDPQDKVGADTCRREGGKGSRQQK